LSTPNNRFDRFYRSKGFAIFGISRSKKGFGWEIYRNFAGSGARVVPVHPDSGSFEEIEIYSSVDSLPDFVDAAIICFNLKKDSSLLLELRKSRIKRVWLQQGSYDRSVVSRAKEIGLEVYTGCALMYLPGMGFPHNLHRFFHNLFSKGQN